MEFNFNYGTSTGTKFSTKFSTSVFELQLYAAVYTPVSWGSGPVGRAVPVLNLVDLTLVCTRVPTKGVLFQNG
jgi:hypothetical protein